MRTVLVAVTGLLLCGSVAQGGLLSWLRTDMDDEAAEKVHFQLYTNEYPDEAEVLEVADLPQPFQRFNASRPTKVIVHGWHGKIARPLMVKDALLSSMEANVLVLNWHAVDTLVYPLAVRRVPVVARQLATVMQHLVDRQGLHVRDLHVVGHSLGAHISGLAALNLRDVGLTVGRITGLDPAGPLFHGVDPAHRLDRSQAALVDIIHTCSNVFGLGDAVGHVDFYPNGGTCSQPGCALLDVVTGKCSHNRAYYLFEESIVLNGSFPALPARDGQDGDRPCESVDEDGATVDMGLHMPESARGVYCLGTRETEPFGYGRPVLAPLSEEPSASKRALMWSASWSG